MAGIVAKFGGSSLADAAQLEKVKKIIEANPERRYVVPSAPGKRHSDDTKVTDLLYICLLYTSFIRDCCSLFLKKKWNGVV